MRERQTLDNNSQSLIIQAWVWFSSVQSPCLLAPRVAHQMMTAPIATTVTTVATAITGRRPCRELVQLWFRDPVAEVTRPIAELVDWQRVDLEPGQLRDVTFEVRASQFAYAGRDGDQRVDPGEIVLLTGPHALDLKPVSLRVTTRQFHSTPDLLTRPNA